ALAENGVARGDRVIVFFDNGWEAVVSIFAILKAGAVFSPINPSTKADKLAFVLNNCRAAGIVTQSRLAAVAARAMVEAPSVQLAVLAGGDGPPKAASCISFEEAVEGTA